MSKFVEPINLEISPASLGQGEQVIRQEIAWQLYALAQMALMYTTGFGS